MSEEENRVYFSKKDITFNGSNEKEKKLKEELFDDSLLIAQKDEEIERLNKTVDELEQDYIYEYNLRHRLSLELSIEKDKVFEKENIIKEVREYKNNLLYDLNRGKEFEKWEEILNPIDEILDKENK